MIIVKLMLVLLASEHTIASNPIASNPIALPNCQSNCGDVDIPYPFGIGRNCSIEGFQVTCNQTKQGDKPYLHTGRILNSLDNPYYHYEYELLKISISNAYARIYANVAMKCSHVNSSQEMMTIELTGTQFCLSNTLNMFTSVGCGKLALAHFNHGQVACVSMGCDSTSTYDPYEYSNYNEGAPFFMGCTTELYGPYKLRCNGLGGCCQTAIPTGISSANLSFAFVKFDNSIVREPSECIYAAIVEAEYFFMYYESNFTAKMDKMMPVILDWSIPIENMSCSSHSYSSNTTDSPRPVCTCFDGYDGNPYLPEGCQDINECERYGCPNHRKCHNTVGSYYCFCPLGWMPDPHDPEGGCQLNRATFAGMVIAGGIIIGVSLYFLLRALVVLKEKHNIKRIGQKRQKNSTRHHEMISLLQDSSHQDITGRMTILGVEELEKATNKFDESLIIGRGGHGIVYKGILSNQLVIAIKRPKIEDDDREIEEFLNEVLILSQLNHRNVVKLVGCCLEDEVPLLVYEFISNGTLTDHLHVEEGGESLSWNDRLRISLEIARALSYLHSAASISVFHRDIKTSNILLTDGLIVKLSDFGASRSVQIDATGVTTIVQGTYGYLDPEYFYTGRLTEKSDVYSFGVILAELLTRKKPYSFTNMPNGGSLVAHFSSIMNESRLPEILDPQLLEEEHISELESVAEVAEMCMRMKGEERPTMKEVEMRLELLWKSKVRIAQRWNIQQVQQQQPLIENQQTEKDTSRAYSLEAELIESANFPR